MFLSPPNSRSISQQRTTDPLYIIDEQLTSSTQGCNVSNYYFIFIHLNIKHGTAAIVQQFSAIRNFCSELYPFTSAQTRCEWMCSLSSTQIFKHMSFYTHPVIHDNIFSTRETNKQEDPVSVSPQKVFATTCNACCRNNILFPDYYYYYHHHHNHLLYAGYLYLYS